MDPAAATQAFDGRHGRLMVPPSAAMVVLLILLHAARGTAQVGTSILHSFPPVDGKSPRGGVTLSSDGATLYGMTYAGGAKNYGVLFQTDTGGGALTVLHVFGTVSDDGKNPCGSLTLSSDGATLYGTTSGGGANDYGTIFSYTISSKAYTILHSFGGVEGDGMMPLGTLTLSSDGATLYGTTISGGYYNNGYFGTVFKIPAQGGALTILHSFAGISEGWYPESRVALSSDGATLYGMTQYSSGAGSIFKVPTAGGTLTYLHEFAESEGAFPQGLTLSRDGATLYGLTNPRQGGWPGNGTLFQMDTEGTTFTVLHTFGGDEGAYPEGNLVPSSDGATLYAKTSGGGAHGGGAVFEWDIATEVLTVLHQFAAPTTDGQVHEDGLTLSGDDATLYGMTQVDGANGAGTVFKTDTGGVTFTVLYSFADPSVSSDGLHPYGSLTLSRDGATLYGLTTEGGAHDTGTLFKMDTGGAALTVLHDFAPYGVNDDEGGYPFGSLALSGDGETLYGMTLLGGAYGGGTIFEMDTGGTALTVLHSFGSVTSDGGLPYGSVVVSGDGATLYGMTYGGGAYNAGAIFSCNVSGTAYSILHSFGDVTNDGSSPYGSLTLSGDGATLYGMTNRGGAQNGGVIFSYDISEATYAILHSFGDVTNDGWLPYGSLALSSDGATLYGMTYAGGTHGAGVIFSYDISEATYAILHSFGSVADDGLFPLGSLALSGATLYGMTNGGGAQYRGAVFKMDTGGAALTVLHSFGSVTDDGQYPNYGHLSISSSGCDLYGMTPRGGANDTGAIFSVNVATPLALTSSSGTSFSVGKPGSFTVTTTGAPAPAVEATGKLPKGVTFVDNRNGTATLAGTPAAGTGGTYPLAIKASNGCSPEAEQGFTLSVTPAERTTLTLVSTRNPAQVGYPVRLTAKVSFFSRLYGVPTGTIRFVDDGSLIATVPLVSAQASIQTSSLAAGVHRITAIYSGDGSFKGSTATLTQTVGP